MRKGLTGMVSCALLLSAFSAVAGPLPADKCEASKNKIAGAYFSCRLKAEATAITKAMTPDYTKCSSTFDSKWGGAETTAVGACPDTQTTDSMNAYLRAQATEAALVIAGDPSNTCAESLAACEAAHGLPQTGAYLCMGESGAIACSGTKQDAESRSGVPYNSSRTTDNTIWDKTTGLEWEILDDNPDGQHYQGFAYTFATASARINSLNLAAYAGHTDWRIPNILELLSIVHHGGTVPRTYWEIFNNCTAGCQATDGECTCTPNTPHWSSTPDTANWPPPLRFHVVNLAQPDSFLILGYPTSSSAALRAVRTRPPTF